MKRGRSRFYCLHAPVACLVAIGPPRMAKPFGTRTRVSAMEDCSDAAMQKYAIAQGMMLVLLLVVVVCSASLSSVCVHFFTFTASSHPHAIAIAIATATTATASVSRRLNAAEARDWRGPDPDTANVRPRSAFRWRLMDVDGVTPGLAWGGSAARSSRSARDDDPDKTHGGTHHIRR